MATSSLFLYMLLLAIALGAWMHHSALASRAVRAARDHVQRQGLQFLDQSAILSKVRFARGGDLGLCLARTYTFEFSSLGDKRYKGWITLKGSRIAKIELQPHHEPPTAEPISHQSSSVYDITSHHAYKPAVHQPSNLLPPPGKLPPWS